MIRKREYNRKIIKPVNYLSRSILTTIIEWYAKHHSRRERVIFGLITFKLITFKS